MNDLFALQARTMRWWMSSMQANADALTTIALRVPLLAASGITPTGPSREARQMVTEKMEAMFEGSIKGAIAGSELALRAFTGQLNATTLASGMVGIAEASQRPANRKVKANARRLRALGA